MKKKLVGLLAVILFAAVSIQCTVKVKVLHKNGKVIEINIQSLEDHLAHGDTFCGFV